MSKKRETRRKSGVTLVEVLVAMVVLVTTIFVAYQVFPMGFAASYRAKNKNIATYLATQKMEEILNGKHELKCLSQDGRPCRFRPVHVDGDPEPNPYDANYDCRYYYGSTVNGRGATFEQFDTGPADDPSCWGRFPAPNDKYWYNVEVIAVLDPACNFSGFDGDYDRISLYRDFGSMVRVTVRVGGPVDDLNAITYVSKGNRENLVEVILSTFVTDKNIPSAEIITDASQGGITQWHVDEGEYVVGRKLLVSDIRNFTFFNQLNDEEIDEQSLVFQGNISTAGTTTTTASSGDTSGEGSADTSPSGDIDAPGTPLDPVTPSSTPHDASYLIPGIDDGAVSSTDPILFFAAADPFLGLKPGLRSASLLYSPKISSRLVALPNSIFSGAERREIAQINQNQSVTGNGNTTINQDASGSGSGSINQNADVNNNGNNSNTTVNQNATNNGSGSITQNASVNNNGNNSNTTVNQNASIDGNGSGSIVMDAVITGAGDGSTVVVNQNASVSGNGSSASASASISGAVSGNGSVSVNVTSSTSGNGSASNSASVTQNGNGNSAYVNQNGNGNSSTTNQNGNGNSSTTNQNGNGNSASVTQTGSGNSASVSQSGNGNSVTIVQGGNGNSGSVSQGNTGSPSSESSSSGSGTEVAYDPLASPSPDPSTAVTPSPEPETSLSGGESSGGSSESGSSSMTSSTTLQEGNRHHLDNVIVELYNDMGTADTSDDVYLYQTNKLVRVIPLDPSAVPNQPVKGYVFLAQPLYEHKPGGATDKDHSLVVLCDEYLALMPRLATMDLDGDGTPDPENARYSHVRYRIYQHVVIPRQDGGQLKI